ncbi:MAG: hypothetical protein WC477_06940 [Patescibacteria group bacterium]
MEQVTIYGAMINAGDGSVFVRWYLSREQAEQTQHQQSDGLGVSCVIDAETFIGSNVYNEAIENAKDDEDAVPVECYLHKKFDPIVLNAVCRKLKEIANKEVDGTDDGIICIRFTDEDIKVCNGDVFLTDAFVKCGWAVLAIDRYVDKDRYSYCAFVRAEDNEFGLAKYIPLPIVKSNPEYRSPRREDSADGLGFMFDLQKFRDSFGFCADFFCPHERCCFVDTRLRKTKMSANPETSTNYF